MGKNSKSMKALVAVGLEGKDSLLLQVWPEDNGPETPWGCEFEASGGSKSLEDLDLKYPRKAGFWVWEGHTYYPGPNYEGICDDGPEWVGNWRLATPQEILDFSKSITRIVVDLEKS